MLLKNSKDENKTNFDCEPFKNLRITISTNTGIFPVKDQPLYCKASTHENSLDQGLKKQALDNGINIHFGQTAPIEDVDIVATGPNPKFKFTVGRTDI